VGESQGNMKKRKLKKWVKEILVLIPTIAIVIMLFVICESEYKKIIRECDKYYGRYCSTYEIDQFQKGIRNK
jgi:uncharacterized protein (UPF0262 family)